MIFVLYVLGRVYEDTGYYLRWDKDEALMAANDIRVTPQYISEVLQGCLSRSIFDDGVFQVFGILTSAGIQRRYLRGCEKRDEIEMIREYWLLDEDDKKDVPASVRAQLTFFQVSGEMCIRDRPSLVSFLYLLYKRTVGLPLYYNKLQLCHRISLSLIHI